MKRSAINRIVLVGAVFILVCLILIGPIVSEIAKRKLERVGVKTTSVHISPLTGFAEASDIEFATDPKSDTSYTASAVKIRVRFSPVSLLRVPKIRSIEVIRPTVTIREVQGKPPGKHEQYPTPGSALRPFPPMRVGEIKVQNGTFRYQSVNHGKTGTITISHVDGTINSFATRHNLLTEPYQHPLRMDASAKFEDSGLVGFHVSFDPFAERNHDSIVLELSHQNMTEANRFFMAESGLALGGTLVHAKADLGLSQGQLSGVLEAQYQDLLIKFHPTPDRGKLEAKLETWIGKLKSKKTQTRSVPVSARREPHEPITKLLIRGLKDAAQRVTS